MPEFRIQSDFSAYSNTCQAAAQNL